MTPIPKKPYDEMTPREYQEWCRELADWYADVWDDWGTAPWITEPQPTGGSVPSVRRR